MREISKIRRLKLLLGLSRPDEFHLATADEAFELALEHGNRLLVHAMVPALVLEMGRQSANGLAFTVNLAADFGTREIETYLMNDSPGRPQVGDLVAVKIVRIEDGDPESAQILSYITAKLLPEYVEGKGWRIDKNLAPPNLKPRIHM